MARRKAGQGGAQPYQRADGLWCVGVSLGNHPDGKRNRPTVYGRTAAECRAKAREVLAKHAAGLPTRPDNTTVRELLLSWLETVVKPTCRYYTYAGYETQSRVHLIPALGGVRVRDLSAMHVQKLFASLAAKGLSTSTILRVRATLSAAMKQAVKWDMVQRSVVPLATVPKGKEKRVPEFTDGQARAILAAIAGHRLENVFTLQLALGLRIGEVLGVRISDIAYGPDGRPALLEITGQVQEQYGSREAGEGAGTVRLPPKTKAGTRRLVLPNLAALAIERELSRLQAGEAAGWAEGHASAGERRELAKALGLLFRTGAGTPYIHTDVRRVWYRVLDEAGLPRIRPHELRHLCASVLLSQGVDIRVVSGLLGHSSAKITWDTYQHLLPSTLQAAAKGIDAALGGEGGDGGG